MHVLESTQHNVLMKSTGHCRFH